MEFIQKGLAEPSKCGQNRQDFKGLSKLSSLVIVLAVILAAYPFIRHLVLYHDLLGLQTRDYYGAIYAGPGMTPLERVTVQKKASV